MSVPLLTIGHYIFLTKEERASLNDPTAEIEVVGVCCPVWLNRGKHLTEKAEEIFLKYKLKHNNDFSQKSVSSLEQGFLILLSKSMAKEIQDVPEGCESFGLNHKDTVDINGETFPVLHIVHVEDMEVLNSTLC